MTSRPGRPCAGSRRAAADPGSLADTLVELTIVVSFSRIGPAIRQRLFGWTDPPGDALAGRTVLVAGPTSGLGRAATGAPAALGARVILLGRSEERLALDRRRDRPTGCPKRG